MHLFRPFLLLVAVCAIFGATALAQGTPQKGVQVGDIDTKADPCQDFFQFANGKWRAENPIPPSMVRWSRRWSAGESTKNVLHDILEDASKNSTKAAPQSTERLIGDYYGACMNEKEVNKQGLKAIKPELDAIHNISSATDLTQVITRLQQEGIFVPFIFGSAQDPHNPAMVMADTGAGGLGLPDRDYYFKDDDKAKETRQKYLEPVTATLQLAGYDKGKAQAAAQTAMRMETALAGASLTNVELRDPHATDHKMKIDEVQKLAPHFDWRPYFQAL